MSHNPRMPREPFTYEDVKDLPPQLLEQIKISVPILKNPIYELWLRGLKQKEIAEKIGCSRQYVNQCIKKYKELLNEPQS